MARTRSSSKNNSSANLGFEAKLWLAADKLRSNMDAAEYKHVVLGLLFLKYNSDAFEEHQAKLVVASAVSAEKPEKKSAEGYLPNGGVQLLRAIGKIRRSPRRQARRHQHLRPGEQPHHPSPRRHEPRPARHRSPLALEQILTRVRLPIIRREVRRKTLLYTHYLQGIEGPLRDALTEDGWRVGFFTGDDKSGLDGFLHGDVDALIGSSAIGTGVDGLQDVCERLTVNVLPWTNAEFEQLKGRIYRQGQRAEKVTVVLPLTFAAVNGERWSWCESKVRRLKFKKSIADAAVDGVVPEGHLRSPAQAYQDVIGWLGRLTSGEVEIVSRTPIAAALSPDVAESERRSRNYGDFSTMNRNWNQTGSAKIAERLRADPDEWAHYHSLYREARKTWAVVPFEEVIRWAEKRSGYVIGDFGCGEAKLATALGDRHTVHSFDYVAASEDVIACDMAHVPMEDESLDVAVFSLSLMGANFADYLREAWRLLKLDGQLHIYEATSRFTDRNAFVDGLKEMGFAVAEVRDVWKFTYIHALRTDRAPVAGYELNF